MKTTIKNGFKDFLKSILPSVRKWLIKRLGGYVAEETLIKPQISITATRPVTLQTTVKADARWWYGYGAEPDGDPAYKERLMNSLKSKLCDAIWETDGAVEIDYCDNYVNNEVDIRATVRMYIFE